MNGSRVFCCHGLVCVIAPSSTPRRVIRGTDRRWFRSRGGGMIFCCALQDKLVVVLRELCRRQSNGRGRHHRAHAGVARGADGYTDLVTSASFTFGPVLDPESSCPTIYQDFSPSTLTEGARPSWARASFAAVKQRQGTLYPPGCSSYTCARLRLCRSRRTAYDDRAVQQHGEDQDGAVDNKGLWGRSIRIDVASRWCSMGAPSSCSECCTGCRCCGSPNSDCGLCWSCRTPG